MQVASLRQQVADLKRSNQQEVTTLKSELDTKKGKGLQLAFAERHGGPGAAIVLTSWVSLLNNALRATLQNHAKGDSC